MSKDKNVKINPSKIVNNICNNGLKVAVLILFVLLFFGFANPGKISKLMDSGSSVVQTSFYFESVVNNIVQVDKIQEKKLSEEASKISEDNISQDSVDFYKNFMNMDVSEFDTKEYSDDDYDEIGGKKANKINVKKFNTIWSSFKNNHETAASVFESIRLANLFTFFAVIICLLGLYFAWGTKVFKKVGLIIILVGSILVCASLIPYGNLYEKLNTCIDKNLFTPVKSNAGIIYYIFAAIIFILSLFILISEKNKSEEKSLLKANPFQYTYRIVSLFLFMLLFIPGANPARISSEISRTVSLFTSGFAYNVYTNNLQNLLIRGFLPESVMRIAFFSSMIVCIGICVCGAGACMSVGNNKLKKYGHFALLGGSTVSFIALFGIKIAYNMIKSSENVEKINPLNPPSFTLYIVLLALIFITSVVSFILTPKAEKDEKCKIDAPYQLFLMLLPFLLLVFVFSYLPLYGWRFAFFDYKPGDTLSWDKFVGLKWFKAPFENPATRSDIIRVLRNTLAMSGLGILGSWIPMIFAIFLAEIKNSGARRVIQTLTTIPNFISWVLVYAIAFCIFGTEGFISNLMVKNEFWSQGKNMLMGSDGIWLKMWLWGMWKGLGWSAIMYIAAISGIDQQLYEAATVDGANRFQKIWHITIPELFPTYIVLLILSVSNILSNGMDQYLCFKNPTNKDPIEVLDLYVYQLSFGQTTDSNIPFSTVVSMFKSLVSVVLLFATNKISKWVRGSSIF